MVIDNRTYVIARTASGRPSLQHKVKGNDPSQTACGYDITNWSRHYTRTAITEVLCRQGACRG